jgi:hypothetical protein
MKFTLRKRPDRGWPNYLFWGRMRTSTFGLIVAFFLTAWLYDTYQPPPAPTVPEVSQVVPPGFVPDPEFTWVPRTSVREYPQTTTPRTRTTTPTPTPSETETTDAETTGPTPTTTDTTPPTTTATPTPTPPNPFLPTPPTPQTAPTTAPPAPVPPVP